MRSNHPALNANRSKLETYILKSLAEEENFQKYRQYIHFPKDFLENFIKKCVDDYCLDKKAQRLKNFLDISLDSFQVLVHSAIRDSTKVVKDRSGNVSLWLDEFCRRLGDVLDLPRSDLKSIEHQETRDVEFLKEAMSKALDPVLENLKKDFAGVDMGPFQRKPHKILAEQLSGCWEQCPFCKAVCTNTIFNHDGDHSLSFHRPQATTGFHWYKTNHLVTDICSSLVASNCSIVLGEDHKIPYKNYRDAGPRYSKWSITPDTSVQSYWKWFVCHFRAELESQHCGKFEGKGEIPSQWKQITKQDVLSELEKQF
ncbi:alpha-1,3-mannosyl-glycoprotein 4-beta-N-acetylglucosaminyltransferase C-like [Platysternon megacephalum]|uniref:Alpha-1,3-mannosyl-glycoprotein 4-beta-N-acetylglucosaminyltransferase C-like n=1 Tax=Platysternon megacephalum TaxID=55544 RepID=A0A4D9DWR1_9SAUR|nr:alpha-1,3-mannosyl-glycoprotein 4-beta-N-acetylglucosaminyltransferase C-like [Platysternon megacephalum]